MQNFLFATICFFAIFGFIQLTRYIFTHLTHGKSSTFSILVTVQDQADEIESIVRNLAWQALHGLKCKEIPRILIVDMGSCDETSRICEKLEQDYPFVKYTSNQNFANLTQEICHFTRHEEG